MRWPVTASQPFSNSITHSCPQDHSATGSRAAQRAEWSCSGRTPLFPTSHLPVVPFSPAYCCCFGGSIDLKNVRPQCEHWTKTRPSIGNIYANLLQSLLPQRPQIIRPSNCRISSGGRVSFMLSLLTGRNVVHWIVTYGGITEGLSTKS